MWFMGEAVGDVKKWRKKWFHQNELCNISVLLSTSEKCLVQIFSAQWCEDMRNTPNLIFGCL